MITNNKNKSEDFLKWWMEKKTSLVDTAIRKNIIHCTVQFFKNNKNGNPEGFASGVLLLSNNSYYLITSAHVFDLIEDIHILIDDNELYIGGEMFKSSLPITQVREQDKYDVGFIKLDEKSCNELNKYFSFLNVTDVEINHSIKIPSNYLILGYPVGRKQTKINKLTLTITSKPFCLLTEPFEGNYEDYGFSNKHHLLLKFSRKSITDQFDGNTKFSPDPHGLSGCGVWSIKSYKPDEQGGVDMKLVGLIHQYYNDKSGKFLVATRVDCVTQLLKIRFDNKIKNSKLFKKEEIKSIFKDFF